MQNYYIITVNGASLASSTAPNDGFIDPTRVEMYLSNLETPLAGFTYALSQAKRRANMRYEFVIAQLQQMTNTYIKSAVATGASATAAPSSLVLTVWMEHGDSTLLTHDETAPGVLLTGIAAISRCVARAMIENRNMLIDVFDPTATTTDGNSLMRPRYGARNASVEVGSLAASLSAAESLISIQTVSLTVS